MNKIDDVAIPLMGFAGFSGAGKTTILEKIIAYLTAKNINIAVIKHAHEAFDMDREGKDSYRHRQAGAAQILISSVKRYAHLVDVKQELTLSDLIAKIQGADLILVEGFKEALIPKIEIYRQIVQKPLLAQTDPHIIAVATIASDADRLDVPCKLLDLDDAPMIAEFILDYHQLKSVDRAG